MFSKLFKKLNKSLKPFYYYEMPSRPHQINIIDVAEQLLYIQSKEYPNRYRRPHKYKIAYDKLQKLCYYAQAWHLALAGNPLFEDEYEAWGSGPANYSLYRKYGRYGWSDIGDRIAKTEYDWWDDTFHEKSVWDKVPVDNSSLFTEQQIEFLKDVWHKYGAYEAVVLRNFTYNESPWNDARDDIGLNEPQNGNRVITKESMKNYYRKLLPSNKK